MTHNDTVKLLRQQGFSMADANDLATKLMAKQTAAQRRLLKDDWDGLLAPLRQQVKTLSSAQSTWQHKRKEVYLNYLLLLRKTVIKIDNARADAALKGHNIPQAARAHGLERDGLAWADWIPDDVIAATRREFDLMYTQHPVRGKHLIPFQTARERSTKNMRWDKLAAYLTAELIARIPEGNNAPLIDAMQQALETVLAHDRSAACPVNWTHLLHTEYRRRLDAWYTASHNGLRPPEGLPVDIREEYYLAEARVAERGKVRYVNVTMPGARDPEF